ncbi:calcium-binding protein [Rubellimicrobium arenae]|uniref:calcium-binding protein n=1 Tax=Rubellimicrobium arenae TaxID=2817372 RepID=UPI001B310437|nr:calcium-binding protein [Rubellimicrobium arenae]
MTAFRITPARSIFTGADGDHAFDLDTPGDDSLTVDAGAFLIAAGANADGTRLGPTGAWTVVVNGAVASDRSSGLVLAAGNAAVSTITVGTEGEVTGNWEGLRLESASTVTNHGLIAATSLVGFGISILGPGTHRITNTGTIDATISIRDSGELSHEQVTNSGTLLGAMHLAGGDDTITNSGLIGDHDGTHAIDLGAGTDKLVNTGTIEINVSDHGGGADRIENSGLMDGSIYLADGGDTIINTGQIGSRVTDHVSLNGGADVFTNYATVDGVVVSGTVVGRIILGGGNDRFLGGATAETVQDGNGADSVALGGGNDIYVGQGAAIGGDGLDAISGGTGIDTYDASSAFYSATVNLDTVVHDLSPYFPGSSRMDAGSAKGSTLAGAGADRISGFENAKGGSGADILYGSGGANVLEGNDGADHLLGYGGNDRLAGGAGLDNLTGGTGRDVLTGGAGADYFHFIGTGDSGTTSTTRDLVTDFAGGGQDVIALDRIDAKAGTTANDTFTFIGTNVGFSGRAGELRSVWTATGQRVQGDVNGDGAADFAIELTDAAHAITLTEADFVL